MNTARLDISEAYKWWDTLRDGNQLTEIRLISNDGRTASGIFDNIDNIISAVLPYTQDWNVYYTINRLKDDVRGLPQYNRIIQRPKQTCNDNTIAVRDYVCVDLDSVRLSGTNATDEQIAYTKKKANEVYQFLRDMGMNAPCVVFSSNGVHLYIKCAMLNTEGNTKLVKRFLQALSMLFSDEHTDIDVSVHNAGRIMRLPSSYSCKGNTMDTSRPQRLCKFVKIPADYKVNDIAYFQKIANLFPEEDVRPSRENNYSTERFNLDAFIEKHNIKIAKKQQVAGGTKYLLETCPWNSNHRSPDSMLFQRDNGAVCFFCYHNSCSDKHWADFRKLYEPDYGVRRYDSISYNRHKLPPKEFTPLKPEDEKGALWLKMSDVKRPKLDVADYIPSGIAQIDDLIIGFKRKHCSLWSGYRGSAKSSILNMFVLNAAQQGYKTALWTGELDSTEVKQWLYLQAAGKAHNRKSQFKDFYYTPDHISERIDPWIDKYLWLFNNEYGENAKQLEFEIRKLKKEEDIDMVILDSLMVLDYDDLDGDRNEKQKNLMRMLTKLAKELNIHIHIVAHPNKNGGFLRANNISGSGHIPDLAQNIFIAHRIGLDFAKNAQDFLSPQTIDDIAISGATNVIEIVKCRDKGSATDHFIKLYFEIESNRLKNSVAEHIVYGWQEEATQVELPTDSLHSTSGLEFLPPLVEEEAPF